MCMAEKTRLCSMDWSNKRPTPLRSSETKAMPLARAAPSLPRSSSRPKTVTLPWELYRPIMPLAIPSLPWPARPPMPNISPCRMSRSIPRTISPGISTWKSCKDRAISSDSSRPGTESTYFSALRPIISSAIFTMLVSLTAVRIISSPSLRTETLSAYCMTSPRRWVIKIMAMSFWAMSFMIFSSLSASLSVRTAVGSSNTSSLIPVLSISRAISTNCL